ncbi:hypothetical protein GcC1_051013 [Golovinomyces cichoracearum]|uniref:Uncharacterized protein n=1 Tax=Golovinomyces cichoracearum TaxID=62708 RepID=A0A420IWI3_9PEZI|nr:hypothetical protein GcC1_051013 [Golovinomyces cichoracearum]
MVTIEDLEEAFANNPSLIASLPDFEQNESNIGPFSSARKMHSSLSTNSGRNLDIRSDGESEQAESASGDIYSPPAWRRDSYGNRSSCFWKRPPVLLGRSRRQSIESSPDFDFTNFDEDETLAVAARTRLPSGSLSPEKRRSPSPDAFCGTEGDFRKTCVELPKQSRSQEDSRVMEPWGNKNNYIRFSVRTEVQHKTEPFEAWLLWIKAKFGRITNSWLSLFTSIIITLISLLTFRTLFQPGAIPPVPDLVKVAGLAKAFEPLIFYSENGIRQIGDLQATGIAVWDLGESVRISNMTSAPIIVKELDDLSESLKKLAIELSRFFANVDGDIDGILIVMDWARRELCQLNSIPPPSSLTTAFDNMNTLLRRWGVLETPTGTPTQLGTLIIFIFGHSIQQRTEATLQKTFQEFLSVLEDAINTELTHSLALFSLFSAIDHRFLNLARTVTREADTQESALEEELSKLWTRILGPNSSMVHKFEKNKSLLRNIRSMTLQNKGLLEDHNHKLLTMKANLENLRRKLVSPLLRGNASTIGLVEQINGLENVSGYLGRVREKQRAKLMEMLYGSGRDFSVSQTLLAAANLD